MYMQAFDIAHRLGYPVMVRPSYVLGGRAMEIVYSDEQLSRYLTCAATPFLPLSPWHSAGYYIFKAASVSTQAFFCQRTVSLQHSIDLAARQVAATLRKIAFAQRFTDTGEG